MVILEHSVICLDIGNSTSHLGVYEMGQLIDERRIPSSKLVNSPKEILDEYNLTKLPLSYCSVFPEAEKSLINYSNKKNVTVFNLNYKTVVDLPITYPKPSQIGQDRLANSFAAFYSSDLPSLVIDVGTATTFDVVTKTGGYEGGVIAPGPQGYLDFLNQNTALLPKVNIREHIPRSLIGKDTKQAMLIGAKLGHAAMQEGLIAHLSNEIELQSLKKPKLILTGGGSTQTNIKNIEYRPDLTIFGLALAFQFNEINL